MEMLQFGAILSLQITLQFKSLFFLRNNTFIKQGRIKLIKSDSKRHL